mmetsp:Transcript_11958/g.38041  ORF Transcript_11958/g.38041 Transcript_11958/m.38041 type:complete len:256 (+) Transcript_11958:428-1195(+)
MPRPRPARLPRALRRVHLDREAPLRRRPRETHLLLGLRRAEPSTRDPARRGLGALLGRTPLARARRLEGRLRQAALQRLLFARLAPRQARRRLARPRSPRPLRLHDARRHVPGGQRLRRDTRGLQTQGQDRPLSPPRLLPQTSPRRLLRRGRGPLRPPPQGQPIPLPHPSHPPPAQVSLHLPQPRRRLLPLPRQTPRRPRRLQAPRRCQALRVLAAAQTRPAGRPARCTARCTARGRQAARLLTSLNSKKNAHFL